MGIRVKHDPSPKLMAQTAFSAGRRNWQYREQVRRDQLNLAYDQLDQRERINAYNQEQANRRLAYEAHVRQRQMAQQMQMRGQIALAENEQQAVIKADQTRMERADALIPQKLNHQGQQKKLRYQYELDRINEARRKNQIDGRQADAARRQVQERIAAEDWDQYKPPSVGEQIDSGVEWRKNPTTGAMEPWVIGAKGVPQIAQGYKSPDAPAAELSRKDAADLYKSMIPSFTDEVTGETNWDALDSAYHRMLDAIEQRSGSATEPLSPAEEEQAREAFNQGMRPILEPLVGRERADEMLQDMTPREKRDLLRRAGGSVLGTGDRGQEPGVRGQGEESPQLPLDDDQLGPRLDVPPPATSTPDPADQQPAAGQPQVPLTPAMRQQLQKSLAEAESNLNWGEVADVAEQIYGENDPRSRLWRRAQTLIDKYGTFENFQQHAERRDAEEYHDVVSQLQTFVQQENDAETLRKRQRKLQQDVERLHAQRMIWEFDLKQAMEAGDQEAIMRAEESLRMINGMLQSKVRGGGRF